MGTSGNKKYDVRAIRFIKSRCVEIVNQDRTVLPQKQDLEKKDYFICLSHFDYLIFDDLSKGLEEGIMLSPLDVIDKDRKNQAIGEIPDSNALKEDNYTYPLYMLLDVRNDSVQTCVNCFWKQKHDYTSVVRIHYSYGKEAEPRLGAMYFINQIYNINKEMPNAPVTINSQNSINGIINFLVSVPSIDAFNKNTININVCCLVYDSLELGDCIVILKSTSMVATLMISQYLNSIPCVLDSYTYIGISPELFYSDKDHAKNKRDQILLNSASTRFTIKELSSADTFFKMNFNNEEIDFITGTTDARIRWKGTPEDSGVLSEKIFLDKIVKLDPFNVKFHKAFRDVITRTGLEWYFTTGSSPEQQVSRDYNLLFINPPSTSSVTWFQSPQGHNSQIPSWLQNDALLFLSLKKLVGAIQTMGKDSVMDDLANLLIPSVRALFARLSEDLHEQRNTEYKYEIENLLEDYFSLIHSISQLESQLVQHPEIYPAPYYIPAAVLQFELQFTRLCSYLLIDRKKKTFDGLGYTFYPVLIPKYQADTSTWAPLDPGKGNLRCELNSEQISPLCIHLPINLLYRPYEAAHQLCHEIAHYCGDIARHRDKRFDALCTCCAAMLVTSWEEMLDDKSYKIDWNHSDIDKELKDIKNEIYMRCTERNYYLSEVLEHLQKQTCNIGQDARYYEHFHNILFVIKYNTRTEVMWQQLQMQFNYVNKMRVYVDFWVQHIDYLGKLCKECYADLAMLILLNCDAKTYCQCISQCLNDVDKSDIMKVNVKLQIDRVAFVLFAMGEDFLHNAKKYQLVLPGFVRL